jgi:hypothetical protein
MKTILSEPFPPLTIFHDEDVYETHHIELPHTTHEVSIYIAAHMPEHALRQCSSLLNELPSLHKQARALIVSTHTTHDVIRPFIEFHLDELAQPLRDMFGEVALTPQRCAEHLSLCGVGLHLDGEAPYMVCDYSLSRDISDELLAVTFNARGVLVSLAHES